MKITEAPDYVELTDDQLHQLIGEVVSERTGRTVQSVEICLVRSGLLHPNEYHCKVFLSKERVQGELL